MTKRDSSHRCSAGWSLAVIALVAMFSSVAGCPTTPARNPKVARTRYKLCHDYFTRAMKAKNAEARTRFTNVALVECRKSIKADDRYHHSHFLIALLYLYKGQQSIAEAQVVQCAQGKEAEDYRKEADSLMQKALNHFERAYKLQKGRDSRIALNLSTVYLYFKRYEKAESFARQALSNIAYNTPHLARGNIGRAQFERGKLHKALKNLKQSVFSERRFCSGHYWLGRVEFALKKFEAAVKRFEAALACCRKEKIAPIQEALLYKGLSLMRTGKQQEALVALKKCVKQAPKSCVAERCQRNLSTVTGSSR